MKAKKIALSDYSKYMVFISIVLVFGVFTIATPNFMSLYSLQNLMLEVSPLLLMACGISFVIFTGGIDLGTGAVASCSCVLTGLYISTMGLWIVPLMLVFGVVMGLVNGLLVTKLKLPSFIVTLCTTNFWACIALTQAPDGSKAIAMKSRILVKWASEPFLGIPVMFYIALVVVVLLFCLQKYTVYGRAIMAVGANTKATRLAGVDTEKAQLMAFVICSTCSALAGVFYAFKLKSAVPTIGDSLGLMAIASVALGGASMAGGRGSVLRTAIGVITIFAVNSGLNMMGVNPLWKDIVIGGILIGAVCLNSDMTGRDIIVK